MNFPNKMIQRKPKIKEKKFPKIFFQHFFLELEKISGKTEKKIFMPVGGSTTYIYPIY